jgi:hypothetical protein
MKEVGALWFWFIGSVFASSGYYRLRNGEGRPPKGWFRLCNEMLRRQRYSNTHPRWPATPFPPPRFSILVGLFFIAAGVLLLVAPVSS